MKDPTVEDKDNAALAGDAEPYAADSGDAVALQIRPDGTVVLPDGRVEQWLPKREKQ